jgi:hypothetical protein
VFSQEVGNTALASARRCDGREAAEAEVGTFRVVVPDELVQRCGAVRIGPERRDIEAFLEHGAKEALNLAVGLWPIGSGTAVAEFRLGAAGAPGVRDERAAIVGQHALALNATRGEVADRTLQEASRGLATFVSQCFGVRQAAGVIDRRIHHHIAGSRGFRRAILTRVIDTSTQAAAETRQLFGVDVHQRARLLMLIPTDWLTWRSLTLQSQAPNGPVHRRVGQSQANGNAIRTPTRRLTQPGDGLLCSCATDSRRGDRCGRLERSTRPALPHAR